MKTENSKKIKPEKTTEPETTFIDDGKFLRIRTELPGIAKEKIKIALENRSTSITIFTINSVIQYKKVINIPGEVRFSKKRFAEGVLELTLEKIDSNIP